MLAIYDQIQELRAEIAHCRMTRRERVKAKAELERFIAEQEKLNRTFDAMLTTKAPPD